MAQVIIKINTDNAAFEGDPNLEIARILKDLSERLEKFPSLDYAALFDINGNKIGYFAS